MMAAISSHLTRLRASSAHWSSTHPRKTWAIATLQLLFAFQLTLFAAVVWATAITTPYLDMLTWQHDALIVLKSNNTWEWATHLLHPHNEHRMVFVRLLTLFDLTSGRGNQVVFIIVTLLAVLIMAWLLWSVMVRQALRQDRALALIIPMLILSSTAALDIGLPINCVYPLSLVFVVAAIVLFSTAALGPDRRGRLFAGAMLCATLAPFSNMTGLIVWPVLFLMGLRSKLAPSLLAALFLLGAAECGLYLWHDMPGGGATSGHTLASLGRSLAYIGIFLGLPFSRVAALNTPGMVFGFILASLAIVILFRDWIGRGRCTQASLVSTGLILTGLGVACMAGLGRANEEAGMIAPARYSLYVLILHTGLIMRALLWLRNLPYAERRPDLKIGIGFALLLVAFQGVSGLAGIHAASVLRASVSSWQPGRHDPCYLKTVFPDLDFADTVRRDVDAYLLGQ